MSTIPKEDINEFYKNWCKNTKRNGGILIGSSIKELLTAFSYQLATDGREELEKELATEKDAYKNLEEQFEKQCEYYITLQSQCTEKEKELADCIKEKWELAEDAAKTITEKDQEITELKKYLSLATNRVESFENLEQKIEELKAENERLKEQYSIMDVRRRNAIKSLEESEKQFEQLQEAYNKLIGD